MANGYRLLFLAIILFSCQDRQPAYPVLQNDRQEVMEHGIAYVNPYAKLEELDDPEVRTWFKLQDSLAEAYFDNPAYTALQSRYRTLEERETDPASNLQFNESGLTFYLDGISSENSELLYLRDPAGADELLFDTSDYKDGDYEIELYKPSYDGRFVAMAMGKPSLFFNEIVILEVASRTLVGKTLSNAKPNKAGSIVWSPDSQCILYIYYPSIGEKENDRNSYTVQYCLGQSGGEPRPIYKDGLNGTQLNPEFYPVPRIRSAKSNYLFIYEGNAADHWDCYYLPIADYRSGNFAWKHLFGPEDNVLYSYGMEKDHNYFFKRIHNGNTELCYTDLRAPDFEEPVIIARGEGDRQVATFKVAKDKVYYGVSTLGISGELMAYDLQTKEKQKIPLPFAPGEISLDYRSPYEPDLWITLSGWTSNPKQYALGPDGSLEFVELGKWADYPEYSQLISEVVEVTSHDGTKVPLSIVRRKDHDFDGEAMGIITAYGAYGFSEAPWFHAPLADFVNEGNIYATAHVRGGGEKGPAWHEGGKMENKPNSWKDLIACSEYLLDKGLVHPRKLALNVNSAGAITGGMAVNERPDLYRVFTGFVPNLNLIRTEYIPALDDTDIRYEFGTIKTKEGFENLLAMDPVANFAPDQEYPSTLMILGYKDYLISPSAPGKYLALLQAHSKSTDRLYLLDVKYDAEHEIDWLEDYSRMLYFTMDQLAK